MSKFNIIVGCTLLVFATNAAGVMFHLKPNENKCLREDIPANEIMLGEYFVYPLPGVNVSYIARDSKGQLLSQNQNITKGRFSFTSDVHDVYEICFYSNATKRVSGYRQVVSVSSKKGIEAKELVKLDDQRGKLKSLEISLRRLQYFADAIVVDFNVMHKMENSLKTTNEKISRLVAFLNVVCMIGMLALGVWQVFYLFRYFKAKKLID